MTTALIHGCAKRVPPRKRAGQGRGPRTMNGALLDVRAGTAFIGGTEKRTRALIARRLIPFRYLGGRIVFIRAELEAWLHSLDGCTLEEVKANAESRR